jgi:hypothetical protein
MTVAGMKTHFQREGLNGRDDRHPADRYTFPAK